MINYKNITLECTAEECEEVLESNIKSMGALVGSRPRRCLKCRAWMEITKVGPE